MDKQFGIDRSEHGISEKKRLGVRIDCIPFMGMNARHARAFILICMHAIPQHGINGGINHDYRHATPHYVIDCAISELRNRMVNSQGASNLFARQSCKNASRDCSIAECRAIDHMELQRRDARASVCSFGFLDCIPLNRTGINLSVLFSMHAIPQHGINGGIPHEANSNLDLHGRIVDSGQSGVDWQPLCSGPRHEVGAFGIKGNAQCLTLQSSMSSMHCCGIAGRQHWRMNWTTGNPILRQHDVKRCSICWRICLIANRHLLNAAIKICGPHCSLFQNCDSPSVPNADGHISIHATTRADCIPFMGMNARHARAFILICMHAIPQHGQLEVTSCGSLVLLSQVSARFLSICCDTTLAIPHRSKQSRTHSQALASGQSNWLHAIRHAHMRLSLRPAGVLSDGLSSSRIGPSSGSIVNARIRSTVGSNHHQGVNHHDRDTTAASGRCEVDAADSLGIARDCDCCDSCASGTGRNVNDAQAARAAGIDRQAGESLVRFAGILRYCDAVCKGIRITRWIGFAISLKCEWRSCHSGTVSELERFSELRRLASHEADKDQSDLDCYPFEWASVNPFAHSCMLAIKQHDNARGNHHDKAKTGIARNATDGRIVNATAQGGIDGAYRSAVNGDNKQSSIPHSSQSHQEQAIDADAQAVESRKVRQGSHHGNAARGAEDCNVPDCGSQAYHHDAAQSATAHRQAVKAFDAVSVWHPLNLAALVNQSAMHEVTRMDNNAKQVTDAPVLASARNASDNNVTQGSKMTTRKNRNAKQTKPELQPQPTNTTETAQTDNQAETAETAQPTERKWWHAILHIDVPGVKLSASERKGKNDEQIKTLLAEREKAADAETETTGKRERDSYGYLQTTAYRTDDPENVDAAPGPKLAGTNKISTAFFGGILEGLVAKDNGRSLDFNAIPDVDIRISVLSAADPFTERKAKTPAKKREVKAADVNDDQLARILAAKAKENNMTVEEYRDHLMSRYGDSSNS